MARVSGEGTLPGQRTLQNQTMRGQMEFTSLVKFRTIVISGTPSHMSPVSCPCSPMTSSST